MFEQTETENTPARETPALQTIRELGQTGTPTGGPLEEMPFHCLTIIGQIEGHLVLPPRNKTTKYEHVIPQLVAIEQNPKIKGLLVVLNTVGGDIEAGLAIAEMLKTMTTPVVSLVLGEATPSAPPLPWRQTTPSSPRQPP